MRAPVWVAVAVALFALIGGGLLASRSPKLRSEVRGFLEGVGILPTWQESADYQAIVHTQEEANGRLDDACVLLVGDSLIEGLPERLAAGRGWANRGISGDRVRHVAARLEASVLSAPCRRVALLIGTNDVVFDRAAPEAVSREIAALLDALEVSGREVFLQTLPPVGGAYAALAPRVAALNEQLRAEASARPRVRLVDLHHALADPDGALPPRFSEDGVHLRLPAYERWAGQLDAALAGAQDPAQAGS